MKHFRPRKWDAHQHYKDRDPTWIKLHKALLHDYEFAGLTELQQCHLMKLWLLYAHVGKPLRWDCTWVARQIGADARALSRSLNALLSSNFIELVGEDASEALAERKQDSRTETETETEKRRDTSNAPRLDTPPPPPSKKKRRKGAREYDPDFLAWWERYPRREAKGDAFDAYQTMRGDGHSVEVLQAGAVYAADKYAGTDPEFIPYPATFLRREQFLDAGTVTTGETGPPEDMTPEQKLDWWKQRFEEDARSNHQGQNQVCGGDAGPERSGGNAGAEPRNLEGLQPIRLPPFGVLHGGRGGG